MVTLHPPPRGCMCVCVCVCVCMVTVGSTSKRSMVCLFLADTYIAEYKALEEFIPKLMDLIRQGSQCVYIHCWGGHGRTGILIAILLAMLYKIDVEKALELTEAYHSKRIIRKSHSPQTPSQFEQVRNVVKTLRKENDTT